MTANNSCPCCSDSMLRHLSKQHSYWYCPSCRIEMPLIKHNPIGNKKAVINFPSNSLKTVISEPEKSPRNAKLQQTI